MGALIGLLGHFFVAAGKTFLTLGKWAWAQGKLLWAHASLLWTWYLKLQHGNILLRIFMWVGMCAAIEAVWLIFSSIVISPLASNFLATVIPASGSGLLSLFWEHGVCLKYAMNAAVAYLGLWLTLEATYRQMRRTSFVWQGKIDHPQLFRR